MTPKRKKGEDWRARRARDKAKAKWNRELYRILEDDATPKEPRQESRSRERTT